MTAPETTTLPATAGLQLPVSVVSAADVRQLVRDVEELEETLRTMRLHTRAPVAKLPRFSRELESFAATNRLNLLLPDDRQRAAAYLTHVTHTAPVFHVSFAAEASRKFTTEIIHWFRINIAPDILLQIGLEPTIAAGCVIRTPNRLIDASLRRRLNGQAEQLLAAIKESPA